MAAYFSFPVLGIELQLTTNKLIVTVIHDPSSCSSSFLEGMACTKVVSHLVCKGLECCFPLREVRNSRVATFLGHNSSIIRPNSAGFQANCSNCCKASGGRAMRRL